MTNPDEIDRADSFINVLASLPADEQPTVLLDFVADAGWQQAPATDTDGRAR
jgi:hypothetical protein